MEMNHKWRKIMLLDKNRTLCGAFFITIVYMHFHVDYYNINAYDDNDDYLMRIYT